jgi:protein TonB
MVPLSLALHALAVAAVATLSVTAVTEAPLRASAVVFHPSPQPHGGSARIVVPRPVRRPTGRTDTPPLVVAPPSVVLDSPSADVGPVIQDAPTGDFPICLSNCPSGDPGGADTSGATGSEGTGGGGPALVRPGGEIQAPRRIRGSAPVYPDLARRAHVEGKVVLECVIDTDGRVTDLRVLTGHPLLADAALDAVRRWEYIPTRLNGQAVRVILTVTVRFGLDKR